MSLLEDLDSFPGNDKRFQIAIDLFNATKWYKAHDLFEEIWHETNGMERITVQAILQIAVAQLHISNGNFKGATILYGEGLGRLKNKALPNLGLDIENFKLVVEQRLQKLQDEKNIDNTPLPKLVRLSR